MDEDGPGGKKLAPGIYGLKENRRRDKTKEGNSWAHSFLGFSREPLSGPEPGGYW